MAAKLLHKLADENMELQKKIGCMNGIFQIFDRHHVVTSRHQTLTLGNAHTNSINFERGSVDAIEQQKPAFQLQQRHETSEKLTRESTESSRVSFSSSCSSSSPLSSEPNREAQPQVAVCNRVIFQESPISDPVMSQGRGFSKHMGLDLRDVVRDSMYREARGLTEVCRHMRREDSPRPYGLKHSTPVDFNESCKALAKLRKSSQHYYNEVNLKDTSHYYVDSHKKPKSGNKPKELPRLLLDSRDCIDLKSGDNKLLSESFSRSSSMNKALGSPKRPPSVVAKLMGLETLPGSPLGRDRGIDMFNDNSDPFSRSLRENSMNRSLRFSPSSPRTLGTDPGASSSSPRWRSSEFVMKPLSCLRYPMEPAPWKQTDRNRFSQKQACSKPVKALSMEGRLKDIEFKHSGKDLTAFKEILDAMQSKGLFDTRNQPHCSNFESQRDYEMESSVASNQDSRGLETPITRSTPRGPIVIMKPARLVEKSGIPSSSLIPIHSLSGGLNVKSSSKSRKATKDRSTGNQRAESFVSSVDNKSSSRKVQSSQVSKERTSKSSDSASPRLHQTKLECDKRSRTLTSASDSSKSRRLLNRQPAESTTSPGEKCKLRAQRSLQKSDDQLNHMRNKAWTKTEAIVCIEKATDGGKIPSVKEAAKAVVSNLLQQNPSPKFSEDGSSEHPSPVSVLNASIYREINPSLVKVQASEGSGNGHIDSGDERCEEDQWNPAYSFAKTTTSVSPEVNRKKLQNVAHLVQKLRRLNSSHDETSQDYIASLCENNDPSNTDHRYISEILLASGLLLKDLGSGLSALQLHPSGYPINPELFLVLEQTKGTNSSSGNEKIKRKLVFDAVNEMLVKKLPFAESAADPWMKRAKEKKRALSAQQILKELCSEIETLQKQAKKRSENVLALEEEEEDFLKCMLDEDVAIQSGKWTGFDEVVPGLVLDLERLLFKDLVNEVVHGEIGKLHANSGR